MLGMDWGNSLGPIAPDIDMAAFERAVRNGLGRRQDAARRREGEAGGPGVACAHHRAQRPARGATKPLPEVSKEDVGLLVGSDVGRSLAPFKDEFDLPTLLQAVRTTFAKGHLLMTDAEARVVGEAFSKRSQSKIEAQAMAVAQENKTAGDAFLDRNKATKGVYITKSGLQYMVLRQGAGPRPKPSDRVRVNYRGTLLDGTEFDSSYGGQPAEFALSQVIPGWTEGLSMMPVGAQYRFWIPGALAYGRREPRAARSVPTPPSCSTSSCWASMRNSLV